MENEEGRVYFLHPKPPKQPKRSNSNHHHTSFQKIKPIVRRYFYVCEEDVDLSTIKFIPASKFSNDEGKKVNSIPYKKQNGYVNLYINGLMQAGSIYSVTSNGITIKNVGGIIYQGTPIIVEMVEFYIK